MQTRTVRTVVYLAAGLGLIVALFAAAEFFDASLRGICSLSTFFSCATVDQSGRTTTLFLPDYLWGIGGFLAILVAAGLAERSPRSRPWAFTLLGLTTAGVALSFYLMYVELALIGALCIVCASDYLLGAIAWVGAIALVGRTRTEPGPAAASAAPAEPPAEPPADPPD